jgi:hypothetical protein
MADPIQEQVDRNYEAFKKLLPQIQADHGGKFALMHDREVIDLFDTARDAYVTGMRLYPDRMFSIQEVTSTPIDLGFHSHAIPQW